MLLTQYIDVWPFDLSVVDLDLLYFTTCGFLASSGLSGKGDKTFKSGKSSVPKTPQPLELKVEQGM